MPTTNDGNFSAQIVLGEEHLEEKTVPSHTNADVYVELDDNFITNFENKEIMLHITNHGIFHDGVYASVYLNDIAVARVFLGCKETKVIDVVPISSYGGTFKRDGDKDFFDGTIIIMFQSYRGIKRRLSWKDLNIVTAFGENGRVNKNESRRDKGVLDSDDNKGGFQMEDDSIGSLKITLRFFVEKGSDHNDGLESDSDVVSSETNTPLHLRRRIDFLDSGLEYPSPVLRWKSV